MEKYEDISNEIIIDIRHNPKSKDLYTNYNNLSKLIKALGLKKTGSGFRYNDVRIDKSYVSRWLDLNYIPELPEGMTKINTTV